MFYNLNLLTNTVDDILLECKNHIEKSIDQTFDQQNLSGNADPTQKSGELSHHLPVKGR